MCLDLLSDFEGYFKRSGHGATGWSPAYSVQSILLQLQAFLLELDDPADAVPDEDDDDDEEDRAAASAAALEQILVAIPGSVRASRAFHCPSCPHRAPDAAWPALGAGRDLNCSFEEQRETLFCFHSRKSWREDCLGLGLRVERHPRSGRIVELQVGLDIVSWTAFHVMGVRRGVLTSEREWTHWIPLWLNAEHGSRALPLFRRTLSAIFTGAASSERFLPQWGFDLVQKLMNHFLVQILKRDVHASEVALEGYCFFHRWLQVFAACHPDVLAQRTQVVDDFIRRPDRRHKTSVPDLGEFLTLMSLDMRYKWADVKPAYLTECYYRNALWVVRQHPHLRNTRHNAAVDELRPGLTFATCKVSLHLCLFHAYFLENVGRPAELTPEQVAKRYDDRMGRPSRLMRNAWQSSCRSIMAVSSWDEFFVAIGGEGEKNERLKSNFDAEPVLSFDGLNAFLKRVMDESPYVDDDRRKDRRRNK